MPIVIAGCGRWPKHTPQRASVKVEFLYTLFREEPWSRRCRSVLLAASSESAQDVSGVRFKGHHGEPHIAEVTRDLAGLDAGEEKEQRESETDHEETAQDRQNGLQ